MAGHRKNLTILDEKAKTCIMGLFLALKIKGISSFKMST